jgi:hypothetical protein
MSTAIEERIFAVAPTPPPAHAAAPGYIQRKTPIFIIFGSFFLLSAPLCAMSVVDADAVARWYVKPLFMWLLGMTHFLITLTVYLQSANLRYFNSTWKNRLLYFAVPAAIFLLFDLYTAFQIAVTLPILGAIFQWSVRFLDFHHVNRQSYGVFQLFKGRSRVAFPAWMKRAESLYFWALTGLLYLTFACGGTMKLGDPLMMFALTVAGSLLAVVLVGFVLTWQRCGDFRRLAAPFTYFMLQSISAILGIFSTALWVFCLAMHYVEYHVLMMPRCFNTRLDPTSRTDRFFDCLRRSKVLFYGVLLALAGGVTYLTWYAMGAAVLRSYDTNPSPYLALVAIFDGIFVFHYFVESLIWKFSQPFYRETLASLYFKSSASSSDKG